MKVLFLSAGDELMTGVVRYNQEVIRGLVAKGHVVKVVTPFEVLSSSGFQSTHEKKFFLRQVLDSLRLYLPKHRKIFREILEDFQPDVVHASLEVSLIFAPFLSLCCKAGIPTVGTMHQPIHREKSLMGLILQLSYILISLFIQPLSRLIVFSELQKKSAAQAGFPEERIVIIPNAVDQDLFSPGESQFRKELSVECMVVYLGRFSYQKNPELVLETFTAADFGTQVKLVMVGEGELYAKLSAKYGNHQNILFTGSVRDRGKVIDILRGADIFVQPSRYEGLSISLLEAMSCGAAPITSAVAAHPDVVCGAGILIAPSHMDHEFPEALDKLVREKSLLEELKKKARERVLERYSLTVMIDSLGILYQSLL